MAIKTDILGMVYEYPDYFVVGREKVREYAAAIKADDPASLDEDAAAELGHDALVAPLTFVSILALMVQHDFFRKVDIGFETMQIVQVDQKFLYHKPMLAGDKVCGRMEVISVNERFGADIVVTRNLALDEDGELVPGGLHHADGPRGRQLDIAQVGPGNRPGRPDGRRIRQGEMPEAGRRQRSRAGLVTQTCADVHSDLGVFPIKRAVRRFLIGRSGSAQVV